MHIMTDLLSFAHIAISIPDWYKGLTYDPHVRSVNQHVQKEQDSWLTSLNIYLMFLHVQHRV
jgi:hypothetical protein